jgi:hypothetical protein
MWNRLNAACVRSKSWWVTWTKFWSNPLLPPQK